MLATKYTVSRDRDDPNGAGNHRKNLRLSLDTSLRRLRTDYLDIYWVHMWDRHTPVEKTLRALDDEVRAGRILYTGISDTRPGWWPRPPRWPGATAGPRSRACSLLQRELLPMVGCLGLTVAAWSPLDGGGAVRQVHRAAGQ